MLHRVASQTNNNNPTTSTTNNNPFSNDILNVSNNTITTSQQHPSLSPLKNVHLSTTSKLSMFQQQPSSSAVTNTLNNATVPPPNFLSNYLEQTSPQINSITISPPSNTSSPNPILSSGITNPNNVPTIITNDDDRHYLPSKQSIGLITNSNQFNSLVNNLANAQYASQTNTMQQQHNSYQQTTIQNQQQPITTNMVNNVANNNTNNNSQLLLQQQQQSAALFSPIACSHCRSLHKKCGRELPNCQRCVQTNHLCIYPERKRKRSNKPKQEQQDQQQTSPNGANGQTDSNELLPTVASNNNTEKAVPVKKRNKKPSPTSNNSNNIINAIGTSTVSPNPIIPPPTLGIDPLPTSLLTNTVNNFSSNTTTSNTVFKSVSALVLDIYFHFYSFGFPLVPKDKMQALLELVQLKQQQQQAVGIEQQQYSIMMKQFYERTASQYWSNPTEMEKDLAVYYALLATCLQSTGPFVYQQYKNMNGIVSGNASQEENQSNNRAEYDNIMNGGYDVNNRSNNSNTSNEDDVFINNLKNRWFQQSKSIIGKYFDDMDSSLAIPTALTFLTYYLSGEGDLSRVKMYVGMVGSLCQKAWSSLSCFGIQRGVIDGGKTVIDNITKIEGTTPSTVMYGLPALLIHRILKPVELFLAEFEEPENALKIKLQHVGNKVRIDLSFVKDWSNIKDDELLELEKLIKFLKKYIDLLFSIMLKKETMFHITSSLTFNDLVLDVYERSVTKKVDEMLRIAQEIIDLTKGPIFSVLPPPFTVYVIKAVKIRLKYGKPTENVYSNINLKDDLVALKILIGKYPYIQKYYGDVLKEVESVLYFQSFAKHTCNIMNDYPTSSAPVSTPMTSYFNEDRDQNQDLFSFFNDSNTASGYGLNFDDEIFNNLFSLTSDQLLSEYQCPNTICIDGDIVEIPNCVKPGSFLPILLKNLSKQKSVLQNVESQNPNDGKVKELRNELIQELNTFTQNDESTKLIVQLFTKQFLNL